MRAPKQSIWLDRHQPSPGYGRQAALGAPRDDQAKQTAALECAACFPAAMWHVSAPPRQARKP